MGKYGSYHFVLGFFFILCRYTYEIAPVYSTIERIVIEKMCSLVGYNEVDGIFSPGNNALAYKRLCVF